MLSSDPGSSAVAVRYPRLRVMANGEVVPGVFEAEITNNWNYAADTFRLGVALSADPDRGPAWWADQSSALVDIEVSLGGDYADLIYGEIDSIDIDPLHDTVRLSGRDLSAGLIETRAQETFANQTSSDIVATLANRHQLVPDAQETTTPVGRYWQLEHDSLVLEGMARATTEWNFLVTLAQHEGFGVWVEGTTLHFRPVDIAEPPTLLDVSALSGLRLARSLTLAQNVRVIVKSWHSRAGQAYVQTASSGSASETGGKNYIYLAPNLTPDAAQKLAQQKLTELAQYQRVVTAEMPGELLLKSGHRIQLQGSQTSFDRTYRVHSVERRIDVMHGFLQRLRAHQDDDAA